VHRLILEGQPTLPIAQPYPTHSSSLGNAIERQFGARETATTRSLYTSLNQCYQTLAEVMALQGDAGGTAASMDALQAQWHVVQAELMVSISNPLMRFAAFTQGLRSKCR